MTIFTTFAYPSIWMQKVFFEIAEHQRDAPIGKESSRAREGFQVTVRLAAFVHAFFQFAYASIAVVPLTIITLVVAAVRPKDAGIFRQGETIIDRIDIAATFAIASLFIPVISSMGIILNPKELDYPMSEAVYDPIYAHSMLLSISLPPLPEFSDDLTKSLVEALQQHSSSTPSKMIDSFASEASVGNSHVLDFLQKMEENFRWRFWLPIVIFEKTKDRVGHYHHFFDTGPFFKEALIAVGLISCMENIPNISVFSCHTQTS